MLKLQYDKQLELKSELQITSLVQELRSLRKEDKNISVIVYEKVTWSYSF